LIVPARLSPSFLIVKVDVRCCPPISYSHFHVPTGSTTLSSAAPARPHAPRTNAIERIAFMIASEIVARRPQPDVDRDPPRTRSMQNPFLRFFELRILSREHLENDGPESACQLAGVRRP